MINGTARIRMSPDLPITWERPEEHLAPDEFQQIIHVATVGQLRCHLTQVGFRRGRSPQVHISIYHVPTGIPIVHNVGSDVRMALARAKAVAEELLRGLQDLPACPDGCHLPYGILLLAQARRGGTIAVHWSGWTAVGGITTWGPIVCGNVILLAGGMMPVDPRRRTTLPEVRIHT